MASITVRGSSEANDGFEITVRKSKALWVRAARECGNRGQKHAVARECQRILRALFVPDVLESNVAALQSNQCVRLHTRKTRPSSIQCNTVKRQVHVVALTDMNDDRWWLWREQTSTPTPPAHAQFRPTSLSTVRFPCPTGWHLDADTASSRSVSSASLPSTSSAPRHSGRVQHVPSSSSLSSIVRLNRRAVPHQKWWRRGIVTRAFAAISNVSSAGSLSVSWTSTSPSAGSLPLWWSSLPAAMSSSVSSSRSSFARPPEFDVEGLRRFVASGCRDEVCELVSEATLVLESPQAS